MTKIKVCYGSGWSSSRKSIRLNLDHVACQQQLKCDRTQFACSLWVALTSHITHKIMLVSIDRCLLAEVSELVQCTVLGALWLPRDATSAVQFEKGLIKGLIIVLDT